MVITMKIQVEGLPPEVDVGIFVKARKEQQDKYKNKNVNTSLLSRGNLEYRPLEDPDGSFVPTITSTPL